MRFGTTKDVARMFRSVPGLLLALVRMLLWPLAIWIVIEVTLRLVETPELLVDWLWQNHRFYYFKA